MHEDTSRLRLIWRLQVAVEQLPDPHGRCRGAVSVLRRGPRFAHQHDWRHVPPVDGLDDRRGRLVQPDLRGGAVGRERVACDWCDWHIGVWRVRLGTTHARPHAGRGCRAEYGLQDLRDDVQACYRDGVVAIRETHPEFDQVCHHPAARGFLRWPVEHVSIVVQLPDALAGQREPRIEGGAGPRWHGDRLAALQRQDWAQLRRIRRVRRGGGHRH
mmetsp:Transcript_4201/g.12647  ORF Transcript_4201/g.12647 Transcript_4201/m.12647 type:complete len:215 (-) Transcript_4201:1190-1834(-)